MKKTILLIAFGIPLVAALFFWRGFRYHDVVLQAEQVLIEDARVMQTVGDQPGIGFLVSGLVSGSRERSARFRFSFSGATGSGAVLARGVLSEDSSDWRLTEVHFTPETPDGRKILVFEADDD